MSSTIYWRPKNEGTPLVKTDGPNRFWDTLWTCLDKDQNNNTEMTISAEDRPILAALSWLFPDQTAWGQLVKALETHDTIIVERRW